MNNKTERDWVPIIISIAAVVISGVISGATFLYNYWNTEYMKQPRIEAVCQTVTDDNGSSKEVINITNKGGHIEGFHANVRTVITIHIDKWLLSENKTTIVSLTPKPLYLEVGYFDNNNTQYTNTKGDLIATIHAIDSSSKIDSLLQDTENEAAHEAGNYICTAFCDYTLIVTYLPAGNTEYYYVPLRFWHCFSIYRYVEHTEHN